MDYAVVGPEKAGDLGRATQQVLKSTRRLTDRGSGAAGLAHSAAPGCAISSP